MKILLITTMPTASEVKRINEEFVAMGHEFEIYDASNFNFSVNDGKMDVPGIVDTDADLVIVRGILKHLKPVATLVKSLRSRGIKVFDNSFLTHKYSISKVTDFIKLGLAGIPLPDTYYVSNWEDYESVPEKFGYPFIIKSVRAGKGASVYKMDNKEDFDKFVAEMMKNEKKAQNFLCQRFVDYAVDLRVLVIGDAMFTMRRIPREGDFRANFSLGGTVELYELDEKNKKLAKDAMDAVNMTIGGVDILIDKNDNRYILEVNHTAGMMGMERATGKNIVRIYAEHVLAVAK